LSDEDFEDQALLARLFLEELEGQLLALSPDAGVQDVRRALHKLKGSAGLVGHRALGDTFGRLERRLVAGDPDARGEAEQVVLEVIVAMHSGRAVPTAQWPDPPTDLRGTELDLSIAERYRGAMIDRLERLDAALAATSPEDGALGAYREIHTIKGAALAVADEVVAWFCHGLEERLVGSHASREKAQTALAEVARHRGVLAAMVADPDAALGSLRASARVARASTRPSLMPELPLPPKRPTLSRGRGDRGTGKPNDATVRVTADTLQDVFDRLGHLGQIPAPLAAGVADLRACAIAARDVQRALLEARRRIGPPKPWGPPAAAVDAIEDSGARLAELAARLDRVADRVQGARLDVSAEAHAARTAIGAMRTTHAADLFERVTHAVLADARRAGQELRVEVDGGETQLDRELADALLDPLLQLARNAVAHGLEAPDARERAGKPREGVLYLAAEATAGSLTLLVEDDGAGVDLAEVRRKAIERGVLAKESASTVDDARLLAFLFRPGFSTRKRTDLLAGRGVGLDVALAAVHRAGATLRLRTRTGHGLAATISVPVGASLLEVIWVRADATWFALPAAHVLAVSVPEPGELPLLPSLAELVGRKRPSIAAATVRIAARPRHGADAAAITVEAIGERDEVHLRPVDPLVRTTGPWSGAIAWGDEIRMALDPQVLVDHAR